MRNIKEVLSLYCCENLNFVAIFFCACLLFSKLFLYGTKVKLRVSVFLMVGYIDLSQACARVLLADESVMNLAARQFFI